MTAARVRLYVWVALGVPTFLFWRESLIWIVFMSYYAILASELAGDHATKAEESSERDDRN